jgi:hypothetical protein
MTATDRSRHIPALNCFRREVAELAGEVEAEKALERLLDDYHRREAARQFAAAKEEYSFVAAPDPTLPPGASIHQIGALIYAGDLLTAYEAIDLVASKYRYRYRLRRKVQNDLIKYAAIYGGHVRHHIFDGREPLPAFERLLVTSWLAAGGRAWIIAELDRVGARRVVPFRGRRDGEA